MSTDEAAAIKSITSEEVLKATDKDSVSLQRAVLNNKILQQFIIHKDIYSSAGFKLVKIWLSYIGIMLASDGVLKAFGIQWLSDSVLITLIGSTTISVIGLFAIILRDSFNAKLLDSIAQENKPDD